MPHAPPLCAPGPWPGPPRPGGRSDRDAPMAMGGGGRSDFGSPVAMDRPTHVPGVPYKPLPRAPTLPALHTDDGPFRVACPSEGHEGRVPLRMMRGHGAPHFLSGVAWPNEGDVKVDRFACGSRSGTCTTTVVGTPCPQARDMRHGRRSPPPPPDPPPSHSMRVAA